jgi:16S rRNA (cytosine1402-N4)-methyltransferase
LKRSGPPEPPPQPVELAEALKMPQDGDWSRAFGHWPVLGAEVALALAVKPGGVYVDATLGGGGHSRLILEVLNPEGRLIALDQDPEPVRWAREGWGRREKRLKALPGNFENLGEILTEQGLDEVDGILLDLGFNSRQLAVSGRGFSWSGDEPLDMRLDPEGELTAAQVVNRYQEKDLADLIWRYGEERASRRVARAIVRARRIKALETTGELAGLLAKTLYRPGPPGRIHPATRTFMALRIETNRELAGLGTFLKTAPALLKPGGRLVVISFHSLEDRLVKEALRFKDEQGRSPWRVVCKKPQVAGPDETRRNPRARSAKLRAAEKIALE